MEHFRKKLLNEDLDEDGKEQQMGVQAKDDGYRIE